MLWIILVLVLLLVYWYTRAEPDLQEVYAATPGHEYTPALHASVQRAERGPRTTRDASTLGDVYRFNLRDSLHLHANSRAISQARANAFYRESVLEPVDQHIDRLEDFTHEIQAFTHENNEVEDFDVQRAAQENYEIIARARNQQVITGIRNDSQNVHDSNVNAATREKLQYLMQNYTPRVLDVEFVNADAAHVVKYIENADAKFADIAERDILSVAYQHAVKTDVLPMLEQQLAACNEGHVVCTTGRVARILDTFTALDNSVLGKAPATRSMLRQESLAKAARIASTAETPDAAREQIRTQFERDYTHVDAAVLRSMIDEALAGID